MNTKLLQDNGVHNAVTKDNGVHNEVTKDNRVHNEVTKERDFMQEMLEARVHLGHNRRFLNPYMKDKIIKYKEKMSIINLEKTKKSLTRALAWCEKIAQAGGTFLFVGTKKIASDIIKDTAVSLDMPHITKRWLGGTLTNFRNMRHSVREWQKMLTINLEETSLKKKEITFFKKEVTRKNRKFSGLEKLVQLPDALIVIDTKKEKIAIKEAKDMGIPVIAVVDTDSSSEDVAYPIYGNDDSLRSINFYMQYIKQAIQKPINDNQEGVE